MKKDWRIYSVFFLILLAGLAITARVFYIQILRGGYYSALALGQQIDSPGPSQPRGNIFFQDRFDEDDGLYPAAANKRWPLLYAVPKEIENPKLAASALADILYEEEIRDRAYEELLSKIDDEEDPYEFIARKLDAETAREIESLGLLGVYIKEEKLRHYPASELASHILGFVGYSGEERLGQYGVEGFYDDTLANGEGDIVLSVDYNIQFMLDSILKNAKERLGADDASAVVINPKTGEIISLSQTSSFDPNNYSRVDNIDAFLSDISQKIFEPGSIFKPFTAAAALNEGSISPVMEYEDKGYAIKSGHTIRNSNNETHGTKNMREVLELSINTGAVYMEERVGHDVFREYIKAFGFAERTGVDLQGEVQSDIKNILTTSRDINFATASFGQGIAVTPIQLVKAFSAFANNGKIVKPHVLSGDGEIVGEPVSAKTAAQVTSMLVSVVENGYGKKAGVPGYKVAGKTGTAQVPKEDGRGYREDKTIHSFIGYAPAFDPKFLALIKVDNPKGVNFSADSVAPLFSEIAEYILNYYEVPPDSQ